MKTKAFHVQPRDVRLWTELGEVVVLDGTTIHSRHFPRDKTGEARGRRLRLQCEYGILRALAPLVTYAGDHRGRLPTIYCLDARGAQLLTDITGAPPRRMLRREPRPETLLHRVGVARLMLTVGDACAHANLASPRWTLEQDRIPEAPMNAPFEKRFILYELFPVPGGHKVACRPDASCWLRIPGQTTGQEAADLLVYWEYDRSTQVLKRLQRRVEGYRLLVSTGAFRKHWPAAVNPTVRVFFITQSEARLKNISEAFRDLPGAELIRLATVMDLKPESFFSEPIWRTVQGERRPILRSPATNGGPAK